MKKIKSLVALSLALCMVLCFAGCSSNNDEGSLKDNLVNGFNNWLDVAAEPRCRKIDGVVCRRAPRNLSQNE